MPAVSSDLLLDVYACAERPERWRTLLDRMCETLDARSAVVQIFRRDGMRMRQQWNARDSFSTSHARLHDALVNNDDNPRTDLRLAPLPGPRFVMRESDALTAGCAPMAALKRRLAAIGLGQSIAMGFPLARDISFSLILHRASDDDRPFADTDESCLRELAPHFEQMVRLAADRDERAHALSSCGNLLDQLDLALILCGADRRVAWSNRAADALLERSQDLALRGGLLSCAERADDGRLARLLHDAAGGAPDQRRLLALGRHAGDGLQLLAFRVADDDAFGAGWSTPRAGVGLLLSEAGRPRAFSAREVAELFGLSPSEAALVSALCRGSTVQDHAHQRGISVGTARIQLKQALSKMGSHRQADLVLRICGSVIGQAAGVH